MPNRITTGALEKFAMSWQVLRVLKHLAAPVVGIDAVHGATP